MNHDEQMAHKLGLKDGADFAKNAGPVQLANMRTIFGDSAESILLRMQAKRRPNSLFALSGYFALAILGEGADRRGVEAFWRPYLTSDTETDGIFEEPYYLVGFVHGALASRTISTLVH